MLKFFLKFFKSLNSNSHPGEIAHAISIGMMLGFLPKNNVTWYILTVFFLFIRINKGALVLSTLLFTLLSPVFDPLFDKIGYFILTIDQLETVYSNLLEIPFVSFTNFNNTIVMGALISGLILYIPLYILGRLFLKLWRTKISVIVKKSKLITILSQVKLFKKIGEVYASIN